MKYISSQPAVDYFIWQLEVFDYQFQKLGYNLNDSIVVFVKTQNLSNNVKNYIRKNSNRVHLVPDERVDKSYVPTLKLHGLYQYYKNNKVYSPLFLHDSDIVFTQYFDWDSIIKDDKIAYCSDTISYVGAQYIDSKSPIVTNKMCEIVGISPDLVRSNQNKSGGAQFILPTGITSNLWQKAENDANVLYRYCKSPEGMLKKDGDPYPIQAWAAEMWSLLWNLWLSGIDTEVHKDMEFAWSNWSDTDWDRIKIYHNAGVESVDNGEFYKGMYINKMPFGEDFTKLKKKKTCNYKYAQIINELSDLKDFYK